MSKIADINEFAKALMNVYESAFKGLGRDKTWHIFKKFFARRALRHLEIKSGDAVEDKEERSEALRAFEEDIKTAMDAMAENHGLTSDDADLGGEDDEMDQSVA